MKVELEAVKAKWSNLANLYPVFEKVLNATEGFTKPGRADFLDHEMNLVLATADNANIYPPGEMIVIALSAVSDPETANPSHAFRKRTGLSGSLCAGKTNYFELAQD